MHILFIIANLGSYRRVFWLDFRHFRLTSKALWVKLLDLEHIIIGRSWSIIYLALELVGFMILLRTPELILLHIFTLISLKQPFLSQVIKSKVSSHLNAHYHHAGWLILHV